MSRPHQALRTRPRRRPRPRIRPRGVMEYWSVRVLRQVRIAPAQRVRDAEGAEDICDRPVNLVNPSTPDAPVLPPIQGGTSYESPPGVKTPG
jgi:hypothetical protein